MFSKIDAAGSAQCNCDLSDAVVMGQRLDFAFVARGDHSSGKDFLPGDVVLLDKHCFFDGPGLYQLTVGDSVKTFECFLGNSDEITLIDRSNRTRGQCTRMTLHDFGNNFIGRVIARLDVYDQGLSLALAERAAGEMAVQP